MASAVCVRLPEWGINLHDELVARLLSGANLAYVTQLDPTTISHAVAGRPLRLDVARKIVKALREAPVFQPGFLSAVASPASPV